MKTPLPLLICLLLVLTVRSQEMTGSWTKTDDDGSHLMIVADGFFSYTNFTLDKFIATMGGSWKAVDGKIMGTFEFNTANKEMVGMQKAFDTNDWEKVDDGTPGALNGAWLITGRMRNGEITERKPGARKTMKILSGTKFQWIAYNTETKEFMGTGGGSYTTSDGRYTENIEFFSRDQSRVGASLGFDYELVEGKWHHKGKSSKGKDIYEVWSLR